MTRPPAEPLPPGATLQVYVIFGHPLDHPNDFVVRRFINAAPGQAGLGVEVEGGLYADLSYNLASTLADARWLIPHGLVQSAVRDPNPWIIEVWV